MGDMGMFSFNQHKNMTSRKGGTVMTSDPELYDRALKAHHMKIGYRMQRGNGNLPIYLGNNYRIN